MPWKEVFCLQGPPFMVERWTENAEKGSDSEDAAKRSANQDEVYMVPAFVGLGALIGIKMRAAPCLVDASTTKDLIKSDTQSIAYQVRETLWIAMQEDTRDSDSSIKSGWRRRQ